MPALRLEVGAEGAQAQEVPGVQEYPKTEVMVAGRPD